MTTATSPFYAHLFHSQVQRGDAVQDRHAVVVEEAAVLPGCARLEGEEGARRVKLHRRQVADERAQVEKVLLVDLALGEGVAAPGGDEGFGCAGGGHWDRFL